MLGKFCHLINLKYCDTNFFLAPESCLQYHMGVQGNIKSFNFEEFNLASQGYFNNLDYTICFRREPGFCTITYSVPNYLPTTVQTHPQTHGTVPTEHTNPGRYFNIIADTSSNQPVGTDQAGAGPYECAFDYLVLGIVKKSVIVFTPLNCF